MTFFYPNCYNIDQSCHITASLAYLHYSNYLVPYRTHIISFIHITHLPHLTMLLRYSITLLTLLILLTLLTLVHPS